jgi:putative acetyltransferase
MEIAIERAAGPTEEVRRLLDELNEALAGPYTPEQRHALPLDQLFQQHVRFFLARLDGAAVACGGIALLDGYAEVKRMYSRPAVRGRGVASALLRRLEDEARGAGFAVLRLETGVYQHDAIRFYERTGFQQRGPFGPYAAMAPRAIETSLFYEKLL